MVETGRKKLSYPNELMGFVNESDRLSPSRIADHLIENNNFITHEESDKIYIYNEGIYHNNGKVVVQKQLKKLLGEHGTTHIAKEVNFHLKSSTYREPDVFEQNKNLIHIKNGILNIDTLKLETFSPEIPSIVQLPVNYNKDANCPLIIEFLEEITSSEEDLKIIQEMVGYCLLKDYPIAKSIMLLGGGSNGKTTLINLIKIFLGEKNVSAVALQDLETSRFSLGLLNGKLANLYPDLSSKAMNQISKFKALTGKDMITAEHKFGHPFTFTNHAKMIFSCNILPKIEEDSEAVWRRWVILNFNNTFTGKDADPSKINKISTPEELSGMLNWAIEGLKRVLETGKFSQSSTTKEIREYYIKMSDPVKAFITEKVIEKPEGFIFKDDLYGSFVAYCKENKISAIADNSFARRLISEIAGVRNTKVTAGGERRPAWVGIDFFVEEQEEDIFTIKRSS